MKKGQIKYANIKATQENRLPVLAIDLDGTLLEQTEPPIFGKPIPGVIEELNKLRKSGWIICIWTCREDSIELREHLDLNNIPYDYINKSPIEFDDSSNKIIADVYVDDRTINFNGDANGLAEKILYFKPWHEP